MLNIFSKITVFTRYILQPLYQRENLLELIEKLSDSLMLVNLVDAQLGQSVWNASYESATTTYFYYFVLNTKDNFEMYYSPDSGENSKLAVFIREVQRLEEFFLHFVSDKTQQRVASRINAVIAYLSSRDYSRGYQSIRDMIRLKAVRTQSFLVPWSNPSKKPSS